ncbi:MAG: GspH/FimT family pseudopilin [Syntrophomonas sp.]
MKNEQGLTLIELLVVIGLLSIVILMAAPRFNHVLSCTRLKADAREMAWVLKTVRQESIISGQQKTVCFYPQSTKYAIRGGDTYWFSPGISYAGSTTFAVKQPEDKPACIFTPSGVPSAAGTVILKNQQGDKLYVIVSVAAGRVRVSSQPPDWE